MSLYRKCWGYFKPQPSFIIVVTGLTVWDRIYECAPFAEQRKHYTKNSINSLTDTSQYHVEVRAVIIDIFGESLIWFVDMYCVWSLLST